MKSDSEFTVDSLQPWNGFKASLDSRGNDNANAIKTATRITHSQPYRDLSNRTNKPQLWPGRKPRNFL